MACINVSMADILILGTYSITNTCSVLNVSYTYGVRNHDAADGNGSPSRDVTVEMLFDIVVAGCPPFVKPKSREKRIAFCPSVR